MDDKPKSSKELREAKNWVTVKVWKVGKHWYGGSLHDIVELKDPKVFYALAYNLQHMCSEMILHYEKLSGKKVPYKKRK